MIVSVKKAILHILDANSGVSVFSDTELDVSDAVINNFITKHIEKIYEDAGLRSGEFADNSGFKYHLDEYLKGQTDLQGFSLFIAERLYDAIKSAENTESCDIIVCDCIINDRPAVAVLKCDNQIGYTHQVIQNEGKISNALINHYSILPTTRNKISECAFVNTDDFSIKYSGKKRKIDGETTDIIAEILLECFFDISVRESVNAVKKIAKKVTDANGGDSIETSAKIKQYIMENIEENDFEYIETEEVAKAVFDGRPVMREEFMEKIEEANVPKRLEVNSYVTKKMSANVKLATDIGIELSFPAEYYSDDKYISILNNDDGTISIQINNIGELISK